MEFLAQSRKMALPDARTMLAKAGISPDGPHEIDVMRMTKAMKKPDGRAKMKAGTGGRLAERPGNLP